MREVRSRAGRYSRRRIFRRTEMGKFFRTCSSETSRLSNSSRNCVLRLVCSSPSNPCRDEYRSKVSRASR
jgi:hypothetical protein